MVSSTLVDVSTLQEPQATLLMPLWARAMESRRPDRLLTDRRAEAIVSSLNYDFSRFESKAVSSTDYCVRASLFDGVVRRFLDQHPAGVVVEIGTGLDTRFDRLDNGQATWIELDLPEAMAIRRQFFEPSERRHMIAGSLLETDWFEEIRPLQDRGVLLVAEGVFYFFSSQQIQEVIARLSQAFPHSAIVFDAQSPLFLRRSNAKHPMDDSQLSFSVRGPAELRGWGERYRVEEYIGFGDMPAYREAMARMSWLRRIGRRLFPPVRHMFKVIKLGW